MSPNDIEQSLNRDEDLKPGRPPRPASEPAGSEGSSRSDKTLTDPATGEQTTSKPRPNTEKGQDRR